MRTVLNGGTIWGDQFARLVQKYVTDTPVLYEIGAFDGHDVTLFLEVIPEAKVVAFEASPYTFDMYLSNAPFQAYNIAVGNKTGKTTFYESHERTISSLYPRSEYQWKQVTVPETTLDDFIQSHSVPVPTVVKIDAEGATYDVLLGMTKTLPTVKVLYLETEDHPYWEGQKLHEEVVTLLPDYECILFHDNNHQFDSIWIRK